MTLLFFTPEEFDDPTEPGSGEKMQQHFLQMLDTLRGKCGFPFVINSGYRTAEHNTKVGGADKSAHLLGRAADIKMPSGAAVFEVVEKALEMGFTGVGIKNHGGVCYVHLDNIAPGEIEGMQRPAMWTYT